MLKIKETDKGNTFLVKVTDNDDCCMTSRFAVININDDLKKKLFALRDEFIRINENLQETCDYLFDVRMYCGVPEYISECEYTGYKGNEEDVIEVFEEAMENDPDNKQVVRIEPFDVYDHEIETLNTEVGLVHISKDSFYFTCYIKHTDPATRLMTQRIDFNDLK